jgi:hypothetical protein
VGAALLRPRQPTPPPPVPVVAHPAPACAPRASRESRLAAHRVYGPAQEAAPRPVREGLAAVHRRRQGRPAAAAVPPIDPSPVIAEPVRSVADDDEPGPALAAPIPLPASPPPIAAVSEPPLRRHEDPRPPAQPPDTDIYSARPRATVPRPALPRSYTAQGGDDLQRILARVEQEAVKAGCSPEYAHGITGALARAVTGSRTADLYPAAMYYFIVNEAAQGHEKKAAEQALRRAHATGIVRVLTPALVEER